MAQISTAFQVIDTMAAGKDDELVGTAFPKCSPATRKVEKLNAQWGCRRFAVREVPVLTNA